MVNWETPEFISECEDVEAEGSGYYPFGYRTGHMILPSSVWWIPLSRILSAEENVGDNPGDSHNDEEDCAHDGEEEPDVCLQHTPHIGLQVVWDHSLDPEVNCTKTEAEEGSNEMNNPDIGFLEVGNDADAKAGPKSNP